MGGHRIARSEPAVSPLARKMCFHDWVPSPVPEDGWNGVGEVIMASDGSATCDSETEKKKPPAKRKKKEKKRKKDDVVAPRDKHYQGHIPPKLEAHLKRVWAWMPNDKPQPRWNTPCRMQDTAKSFKGWTKDEINAKDDHNKITNGRGELLTPYGTPHGQELVSFGVKHTRESPDTSDPVIVLHGLM